MKYMDTRAFLIDPIKKQVFQVQYSYLGDPSEIAKLLRAKYIESVDLDDKHTLWVDEEGMFKDVVWRWSITSEYHPEGTQLVNFGLVTGIDDEGETVPPTMSFEQLDDSLTFTQEPLINKDALK